MLQRIIEHNFKELVKSVPFFSDLSPSLIMAVIGCLKLEVFLPGDYIAKAGSIASKMYFIHLGSVEVITTSGESLAILSEGSYFGGETKSLSKTLKQ